jgi:hypothetical protein
VGTLQQVLSSGRIAGLREHRGVVVAEGKWPAIIDEETHAALRVALAPRRRWKKQQPRSYYLVGLLRCSKCGGPLRSLGRENGGRSYSCRKGAGFGGCGGIVMKAQDAEGYIRDVVLGMLADPETRRVLVDLLAPAVDTTRETVGNQLAAVQARRSRLIELFDGGDIDKTEFRRRASVLDEEREQLEQQLVERSGSNVLTGLPDTFDGLVEIWKERGIDFQRLLVQTLLEPIKVLPGRPGRGHDPAGRLVVVPRA